MQSARNYLRHALALPLTLGAIAAIGAAVAAGCDSGTVLVAGPAPTPVTVPGPVTCVGGTQCGNECVDTARNFLNCGACGNACQTGYSCSSGACVYACPPGTTSCNGACVDPTTDSANCGACGTACAAGKVCNQSACASACSGSATKCTVANVERCVETSKDPANCGACGAACKTGETCNGGVCGIVCQAGYTTCPIYGPASDAGVGSSDSGADSGDASSDAEAGTTTTPPLPTVGAYCAYTPADPNNCGACGVTCRAGNTCTAGSCVPTTASSAPVALNGTLTGCSFFDVYSNRRVGVDGAGNIYAMLNCQNAYYVTSSSDSGATFRTPVLLAGTSGVGLNSGAIVGGLGTTAYATWIASSGQVSIARTTDGGVTWTTPNVIASGSTGTTPGLNYNSFGVSIATRGSNVFISGISQVGGYRLLRNTTSGIGAFAQTGGILPGVDPNEALIDPANNNVWAVTDTTTIFVAKSSDNGATFAPYTTINNSSSDTDWALGGGRIYFSGLERLAFFSTSLPAGGTAPALAVTDIVGQTNSSDGGHSISADELGNLYHSVQFNGTLYLERVVANTARIADKRVLGTGTHPTVVALAGGRGCVVVYEVGATLTATVQLY